jgi:hypothetical protein
VSDQRAPTLDYQPPPVKWRTHRWWTVWLPMSITLLALAWMFAVFVQRQRMQAELAAARAAAQAAMLAQAQTMSLRALPIIGIWTEGGYPPSAFGEGSVIVAIWSDGRVVWRDSRSGYRSSKIDPARVDQLLRDLDAAGFFATTDRTLSAAADAQYAVIAARFGEKRKWFGAWSMSDQHDTHDRANHSNSNASFAITSGRFWPMFSSSPAAMKLATRLLPP